MSLTDNARHPATLGFPCGREHPTGRLSSRAVRLHAPGFHNNVGVLNTGFGLGAGGDELYLYDKLSRGGGLLDSLVFGIQAPDLSIGRIPNAIGIVVVESGHARFRKRAGVAG
jgi:hypothetical protein